MAKIAIDARKLRTSTGRYIERLLYYLQQLDTNNQYLVLLRPQDVDGWVPSSPNFTKLVCPYTDFSLGEQVGMLRQLKSLGADLVHFGMTQQPVFYRGKTITTIHDLTTTRFRNPAKNALVFTLKQQAYKWGVKRVARKSAHILVPSEFVKKDLAHYTGIDSAKITVTYEAADKITEPPKAVLGLENKTFILYVGRPQPHKNLRRLVDAFLVVKQSHPDLCLVLAGKNDRAYALLKTYVAQKSLADVVFTGFISEGQLRWLYEHAQAYVFPSLSEGFGLPGLEAMQYNLPVVSSNATCLPEIYKNAALYFNPLDARDMAVKILEVLNNPILAKQLARGGQTLLKTYSWQRTAKQTLTVYKEALMDKKVRK